MKIAYLDCFSGISGDMLLGALVDAGLNPDILRNVVDQFSFPGLELKVERAWRSGLAGTKVDVLWDQSVKQPHRGITEVRDLMKQANLASSVHERADAVFSEIARAEAHVHGCRVEEVHFHEVGAIDAVVDIVGACAGIEALGIEKVYVSELRLGKGFAWAAHGKIPVPVMATLEILKGVPCDFSDVEGELVTPTGAALAKVMGERFGRGFSMSPTSIGYGFGTKERENPPNALRLVLGQIDSPGEVIEILETNVDDVTPQALGHLQSLLLEKGALDVITVAASMKKSRPGHFIQVLCAESDSDRLTQILFEETWTLGVRRQRATRTILPRTIEEVSTSFGRLRVKGAQLPSGLVRQVPEYDDVVALAREKGLPFIELHRALMGELNRREDG